MTLTKHGLNYSKCTFTELKQFIRNRDIDAIIRDRKQMIRALRQADQAATIDFLDLPPELRCIVYEYAFEVKTRDDMLGPYFTADLAILLACKLTYEEAANVFYTKQAFPLSIHLRGTRNRSLVELNNKTIPKGPDRILRWPGDVLTLIRSLTLTFGMRRDLTEPAPGRGNGPDFTESIWQSYSMLGRLRNLQYLEVNVIQKSMPGDMWMKDILSPLPEMAGGLKKLKCSWKNDLNGREFSSEDVKGDTEKLRKFVKDPKNYMR